MNQQRSLGFGGLKQLLQFCLGLVVATLLINASGIHQWAERLEIGNEYVPRQALVDIAGSWEGVVEYTGLNTLRRSVMAYRDTLENKDQSRQDQSTGIATAPKLENSSNSTSDFAVSTTVILEPNATVKIHQAIINQAPTSLAGASSDTYIALVGDSMMAVGLAQNLTRMIEKNSLGKVVRAYKSGTGLARPDVFNWLNEYPKMLAERTPAIVICAIGANDGQGIQVDKRPLQFGTPAWEEEYAKRVGAFSELLLKGGAKVYWILLPHMRSPVYNQRMQNLNAFLQAKFKDVPNLVFISPDSMIAGKPINAYVEYVQVEGKQLERIRGEDGIHLSDAGARRLAAGILNILQ